MTILMIKTRTYRVVNGRLHFKCFSCQSKRMVAVPPNVRMRSLRCHRCGEVTRAALNRRVAPREQQRGKAVVTTSDGKEIEVDLFDISLYGVGFEIPVREARKIAVGKELKFRCPWNPQLLSRGYYVVKSINGRRVGAEMRR